MDREDDVTVGTVMTGYGSYGGSMRSMPTIATRISQASRRLGRQQQEQASRERRGDEERGDQDGDSALSVSIVANNVTPSPLDPAGEAEEEEEVIGEQRTYLRGTDVHVQTVHRAFKDFLQNFV